MSRTTRREQAPAREGRIDRSDERKALDLVRLAREIRLIRLNTPRRTA